jgi:CRP-like cAMP-binding protein
LLRKGRVKVISAAPNGRRVVMAIRGPGDLVGELSAIDGGARPATVTALGEVHAVVVSRSSFERVIFGSRSSMVELLRIMGDRQRESMRRRLEFGAYGVPARVARLLLDYARAHGEYNHHGIRVSLTHTELAESAVASEPSTSRAIAAFRRAGALETRYRSFIIVNPDVLERFTEEDT